MLEDNDAKSHENGDESMDADGKNVVNPPKGGSPKKGIYLESLRFFRHFIVLKFKSTEDEYDVSKLSVRELKKLLDPSTKTPQVKKPRQRAFALQDLLKQALEAIAALLEDNAALRIQLKELSEKIMLFQGGVSPVAETETPADVIAPTESTSGGESIDALLERIESSFVDAVPATVETGIAPEGGHSEGGANGSGNDEIYPGVPLNKPRADRQSKVAAAHSGAEQ